MQKISSNSNTRTSRGWHQEAAWKGIPAIWKHGVYSTITSTKYKGRPKIWDIQTVKIAVHNILISSQSAARPPGRIYHHRTSTSWLAHLLRTSISANSTNLRTNSSAGKKKRHRRSTEKHNTRSNCIGNSQTIEARKTITPMGTASTPKPW